MRCAVHSFVVSDVNDIRTDDSRVREALDKQQPSKNSSTCYVDILHTNTVQTV